MPIVILSSITKVFEVSIFRNLGKVVFQHNYYKIIKEVSHQWKVQLKILMICLIYDLKQRKANKHWSYLIFIDLKRAYDNVNRNMLLNTIQDANISG